MNKKFFTKASIFAIICGLAFTFIILVITPDPFTFSMMFFNIIAFFVAYILCEVANGKSLRP